MRLREAFTACSMALLLLLTFAAETTQAQTSATHNDPQHAFIENLRTSVVRTIGAQDNQVEAGIKGKILVVSRINSNLSEGTHGARNNEASAIASVVSKALADKLEYKYIIAIRVEYMTRNISQGHRKVIDTVEFRKNPDGTFQSHIT
jgi:hypothetical protein